MQVILDMSYLHPNVCVSHMKGSDASGVGVFLFPSLYSVTDNGQKENIALHR